MFHRWLTAARARRHKRSILREKELELDRANVQVAWDRWRERYMDEKLRPLVSPGAPSITRNFLTPNFTVMPDSYPESKELSLPCIWYMAFEDQSMCRYFQHPAMPHF